jgi:endonuclease YncB( thermonuclease family)
MGISRYAVLVVALLQTALATAVVIEGRVLAIADGDTLTLLDGSNRQHRIRVVGIDSPEKKQSFGQRTKASLSALAYDKAAMADCRKIDRYRRNLCVVFVDGKDVGLEQLRSGMAWHYKQYARDQPLAERITYARAENEAQARKLGLWAEPDPLPPWAWRRNDRAPPQPGKGHLPG